MPALIPTFRYPDSACDGTTLMTKSPGDKRSCVFGAMLPYTGGQRGSSVASDSMSLSRKANVNAKNPKTTIDFQTEIGECNMGNIGAGATRASMPISHSERVDVLLQKNSRASVDYRSPYGDYISSST